MDKPNPKPRKQRPRIDAEGNKRWFLNRKLHREDGPAVEFANGNTEWYQHGQLHRVGGPAIILHGTKYWYQQGKLHREDGPAIHIANSYKSFYYRGRIVIASTTAVFKRKLDALKREEHAQRYL